MAQTENDVIDISGLLKPEKLHSGRGLLTRADDTSEPADVSEILKELEMLKPVYLLFSRGVFDVYCAPYEKIPILISEIGRLREITFREVGEGTNRSTDLDSFDIYYQHLFVWDRSDQSLVGAYRIGTGREIMAEKGAGGFYINTLFAFEPRFNKILERSVELGRSFIVKKYQRLPNSLALLWKGIIAFLLMNPDYEFIIGPVSISNDFPDRIKSLIVNYINQFYFDRRLAALVKSRNEYKIPCHFEKQCKYYLTDFGPGFRDIDILVRDECKGNSIPVLLKKYLMMQGKAIGFNVDPDFNFCLDVLVIARITEMPSGMLETFTRGLNTKPTKKTSIVFS